MSCHMYPSAYPDAGDVVVIEIQSINQSVAYVTLPEYNDVEGMILLSNMSKKRAPVLNLKRAGKLDYAVVLRVDALQGYIDLSKRAVLPGAIPPLEAKWKKSKLVHSIAKQVAGRAKLPLERVYQRYIWPLYDTHEHAHDAFVCATLNEDIFDFIQEEDEIKQLFQDCIVRRLRSTMTKYSAVIELTCYEYNGVDIIKEAMRAGAGETRGDMSATIRLIAPPNYLVTASSFDPQEAEQFVKHVYEVMKDTIERGGGNAILRYTSNEDAEDVHKRELANQLKKENAEQGEESNEGE